MKVQAIKESVLFPCTRCKTLVFCKNHQYGIRTTMYPVEWIKTPIVLKQREIFFHAVLVIAAAGRTVTSGILVHAQPGGSESRADVSPPTPAIRPPRSTTYNVHTMPHYQCTWNQFTTTRTAPTLIKRQTNAGRPIKILTISFVLWEAILLALPSK